MNKKISFLITFLLFIFILSCQTEDRQSITSSKLQGKWELKTNKDFVSEYGTSSLIFKNNNIVEISNVVSIKIGTYDTLQVNSGVFRWRISNLANLDLVDILCSKGSLALSFNLNKNGNLILNHADDLTKIRERYGTFEKQTIGERSM